MVFPFILGIYRENQRKYKDVKPTMITAGSRLLKSI
jgi:hypothetical protein